LPGQGYEFTGWEENGSKVFGEKDYTFTAKEDRELIACFSLEELRLKEVKPGPGEVYPEEVEEFDVIFNAPVQLADEDEDEIKIVVEYDNYKFDIKDFEVTEKGNVVNVTPEYPVSPFMGIEAWLKIDEGWVESVDEPGLKNNYIEKKYYVVE